LNLDVPKEFDLQGARLVAVLRMSAFLGTIQNLDFRTAVVSFDQVSLTITYHPEQSSVVPPYFSFNIYDRNQIRAVASMVQIFSANAPALPVVERLDLEANCYSSGFMPQHTLWYTLLRSFRGVKTLRTDRFLATELFDVLDPHSEAVTNELLPELSELVAVSQGGSTSATFFVVRPCAPSHRPLGRLTSHSTSRSSHKSGICTR
jgi:hypothetical protein